MPDYSSEDMEAVEILLNFMLNFSRIAIDFLFDIIGIKGVVRWKQLKLEL